MPSKTVVVLLLNTFENDSRVYKESVTLASHGYVVKIVCLWEPGLPRHECVAPGVSVHRIALTSRRWGRNLAVQILKYLELLVRVNLRYRHARVYHCNDLAALPLGLVVSKAWGQRARILYDCHEYETETKTITGFRRKAARVLERLLIRYVDRTVTVNESIADAYVRLYRIDKPVVVMNCPSIPEEMGSRYSLRDSLRVPASGKLFLYLGALSHGRLIEVTLEAFMALEPEKFWVVFMGSGPLAGVIKEKGRSHVNIRLCSPVHPRQVVQVAATADFGLSIFENTCLNHYYSTPNKFFDYIMARLPVIVSDSIEQRRIVESERIGVVVQDLSTEGLKDAFRSAIHLDMAAIQKREAVLSHRYSWEEQEKVLLQVYNELMLG